MGQPKRYKKEKDIRKDIVMRSTRFEQSSFDVYTNTQKDFLLDNYISKCCKAKLNRNPKSFFTITCTKCNKECGKIGRNNGN